MTTPALLICIPAVVTRLNYVFNLLACSLRGKAHKESTYYVFSIISNFRCTELADAYLALDEISGVLGRFCFRYCVEQVACEQGVIICYNVKMMSTPYPDLCTIVQQ